MLLGGIGFVDDLEENQPLIKFKIRLKLVLRINFRSKGKESKSGFLLGNGISKSVKMFC